MSRYLAMVCVCLLASACGDDRTAAGPAGSTSSSAGGGGQGGDGGSDGGPDGSSSGGGGGGGSGDVDCSAFDNDEAGTRVTFTVTNHRATPLYYRYHECFERFRIGPEGGRLGTAEFRDLQLTCEAAQTEGPWPYDCDDDTAIQIAAGQSAIFHWAGLLYEPQQMPIACVHPDHPPFAENCQRAVAVQPGAFEFALELFGAATCEDGSCASPIDPFTVEQGFTYPDDTAVAIAVD
ncbi:hypothetical protein WMF28_38305 [Sorangium sp. So ce590]|uniref:hypothetical protein n=1 Tax=Sorangium sp. So ce590 TaxID=3133317 RepID=UPI003F644388